MNANIYNESAYQANLKDTTEYTGVNPKKFVMWIGMASMTMFFMALVSALIIKRGDYQVWENFKLPINFVFSSLIAIVASVLIHFSMKAYQNANFKQFRLLLVLAFVSGILFLVQQYFSLQYLASIGKSLSDNISGSFIHMIAIIHGGHIVVLLFVTLIFVLFAFRARKKDKSELVGVVNKDRQLHIEMLASMWHYLGAMWLFLHLFFYFNYQ